MIEIYNGNGLENNFPFTVRVPNFGQLIHCDCDM